MKQLDAALRNKFHVTKRVMKFYVQVCKTLSGTADEKLLW